MPYLVQFVDRITANPTVRLDVCGATWILRPESDLSPPPLRRAVASTLLADGQIVPAAVYDNRLIRLVLRLETGFSDDAAATSLQQLARELDRPANILRWQPGTTNPVFFRTLRAEFGSIRWDPVGKTATVLIPAEPFAVGVKVDLTAALNANPFFEVDASSWSVTGGTFARSTAQAHQGAASGLLTPNGVTASVFALSEQVAATAGATYRISAWVRCAVARSVDVAAAWSDAAGAAVSAGGTLTSADGFTGAVTANTWTLIEGTVTAPPGTAQAAVRVRMTGTPPASNTLHIDEAQLTAAYVVSPDPATTSPPLNSNPYFEVDAAGWTPAGGTFARSTAQAHQGAASGLLTPDGVSATAQVRSESVVATPGATYTLGAWMRCAAARNVVLKLRWNDGALGIPGTTVSLAANTWTFVSYSDVAPVGTTDVQLAVDLPSTPPASALLHVDEAQIGVIGSSNANGCYFEIGDIKGDVETPLILRVPGTGLAGLTSVFAARRRGTPSAAAFAVQAETLTLLTDTSLPGNDTLMSGTGSNYTRTTFATIATMRTRVNGFVSLLPASTDMRGTYRVLARMRHSIAADIISVRLTWGQGITKTANDPVTLHTTGAVDATGLHYYDLGLLQMPPGADPVHDGYSGVELAVDPSQITVDAARVSGSGNLDIDHLLIVPADDRLLFVTWPSPAGDQLVLDGTHEMVVSMLTSGSTRIYGPPPASLSGGFPMVSPNATNRINFIRRVNSGLVGQGVLTGTQAFSPEYYPRYLYVRPVAS